MEAKDTVMSDKQLEKVENNYIDEDFSVNVIRLGRGHTEDLRERIAQAQAEISFKAGIREVVEWIKLHQIQMGNLEPYWQTKLKEWGGEQWI